MDEIWVDYEISEKIMCSSDEESHEDADRQIRCRLRHGPRMKEGDLIS